MLHVLPLSLATVPAGLVVEQRGPPVNGKDAVRMQRASCATPGLLNGSWKDEGSLTSPRSGRLLQAQLRTPRNALHCFQPSD